MNVESASGDPATRPTQFWLFPLGAICLHILVLNAISISGKFREPVPDQPFESLELVEQWRVYLGNTMYEDYHTGHATHVYGPLGPLCIGRLMHLTGPSMYTGRACSALAGLGCVLLLIALLGLYRRWIILLLSSAFLIGLNDRMEDYWGVNKPDLPCTFFCLASLPFFYLGYQKRCWLRYGAGLILLICGFLFKQTGIMFAAVPAVAIFFSPGRTLREKWPYLVAPILSILGTIQVLRYVFPLVYLYLFKVPGNAFTPTLLPPLLELIQQTLWTPLFLFCAGLRFILWKRGEKIGLVEHWVLAGACVLIPASAGATARWGAGNNSFIPGYFAFAAFCLITLELWFRLRPLSSYSIPRQFGLACLFGILLFFSIYKRPTLNRYYFSDAYYQRTSEYAGVCEKVRSLDARVVCPNDPTILLMAGKPPGRHVFAEPDDTFAADLSKDLVPPSRVWHEIARSDYVVNIVPYFGSGITNARINELGFEQVWEKGPYSLWKNTRPDREKDPQPVP